MDKLDIRTNTLRMAGALALLLALPLAHAGTIYKYRGDNGQIEYSTTRPVGRAIIAELDSKQLAQDQRNIVPSSPNSAATVQSANARIAQVNQANDNVIRAEQNLRDAQAALEAGREPLPGERIGTVSGYSRLNDSYATRVAGLEQAVEQARANLDQAYRNRNAQ